MSVLEGLTSTLAPLAKASETQTAMLASLKEDLLLRTDSDEDGEAVQRLNDSVDLNAALTDVLDPSDTHTRELKHQTFFGRRRRLQTSEPG